MKCVGCDKLTVDTCDGPTCGGVPLCAACSDSGDDSSPHWCDKCEAFADAVPSPGSDDDDGDDDVDDDDDDDLDDDEDGD